MYKDANKKFLIEENIYFLFDRACQGYQWAFETYQKIQSCQFCFGLTFISDRAMVLTASAQDNVSRAKELLCFGYSSLDQDADGYVSLDDLKKCSSTAYTFIATFSLQDLKSYKLKFYEEAIKHLKSELKAEEQKELKK